VTARGHSAPVSAAAVSPDGQVFASAGYDRDIVLWHAERGHALGRIAGHAGLVNDLDWAPDGSALASASSDHSARLWQPLTGDERVRLVGHRDDVNAVRFSPDGARLATASFDGTVRVWTRAGEPLLVAAHHAADVNGVAWFPDGRRLAAASDDGTVSIFDDGGRVRRILRGHTDWVDQVAVHPSGHLLASASLDRTVGLWNPTSGECVGRLRDAACAVKSVAFSRDGARLAASSYDGSVRVYDAERFRLLAVHAAEGLWNRSVAFTARGVLTGSFGGGPVELCAGGVRRLGAPTTHGINGFAIAPGRARAALCSDDGRLYAVDLAARAVRGVIAEHGAAVLCAAYSPDGTRIATGSWDRTARVWDARSGACLGCFGSARDPINAVQFHRDGRRVWLGSFNGDVRLWDFARERALQRGHHEGSVKFLDATATGAVSVGRDGWVRSWTEHGAPDGFATGSAILNGVASAPRRGWLATVSRRNGIELWTRSGQRVGQFAQHPCSAKSVAWSADEQRVAAAYYDGHLALLQPDEGLARVDAIADAPLSQVQFWRDALLVSAWDDAGSLHFVNPRTGAREAVVSVAG
jgi:WD40 repeat protein